MGVCLSYTNSMLLVDNVKGNFNTKLIEAIQSRKQIRLVGDNVNFYVGVRDERKDRRPEMMHYFGSAILIRELSFPDFCTAGPQLLTHEITSDKLLPEAHDIDCLVADYAYLAMKVASNTMPYFNFLTKELPTHLTDQHSQQVMQKTVVIPLACLPRNEQYETDVIEILR